MDTKMTAIITGLIVIGAAAGIGTYVGMDRDGSEQTSDYAILDDLDANLRRGLTAEVIENNQNTNGR